MSAFATALAVAPVVVAVYAYVAYPAILWLVTRFVRPRPLATTESWPSVTVTIPVYNAVSSIRATLDGLVALDYPRSHLQLLVLSDASNDGTEAVVAEYARDGVELWRSPERNGKTALENIGVELARGEIIVNVDGTVVIPRGALKRLVSAFADPTVGVASGRDVSMQTDTNEGTTAESGYVGYEMWLRDLETRAGSIVGASGCFYGIRRCIHDRALPFELSWDFASAMVARAKGFRSVSVSDAVCVVPRTPKIHAELRRKVRTMARGIRTLFYHASLMNPLRYGRFSFMLVSHKLLRWLPYLLAPLSLLSLGYLAATNRIALWLFGLTTLGLVVGLSGLRSSWWSRLAPVRTAAFLVAACVAGFLAWWDVARGVRMATWEPTQRSDAQARHAASAA